MSRSFTEEALAGTLLNVARERVDRRIEAAGAPAAEAHRRAEAFRLAFEALLDAERGSPRGGFAGEAEALKSVAQLVGARLRGCTDGAGLARVLKAEINRGLAGDQRPFAAGLN